MQRINLQVQETEESNMTDEGQVAVRSREVGWG